MYILIIEPNESYYYGKIEDKIEEYQKVINGYIEIINLKNGLKMIVDEEGKIKNLPFNSLASHITYMFGKPNLIVGKIFITGSKEDLKCLKYALDMIQD